MFMLLGNFCMLLGNICMQLGNFYAIGQFCMLLGNFCMVFGIFACYWAIFTIVDKFYYWKLSNIQQIRKPSGHSADPKKTFLQSS